MRRAAVAAADASTVVAVCGLAFEARIAARMGVRTIAGGGRPEALVDALEREVASGATALLSFGLAGALVPTLRAGELVIATSTIDGDTTWATHAGWSGRLRRSLPDAIAGPIAGSAAVVGTSREKAALHRTTGAIAVDMESQVVARVASSHGLPFAVLRAIADSSRRTLPPAAAIAMRADGRVDLPRVLRSLAARPGQLASLVAIGLETRRALRALDRGSRLAGHGLGGADLDQLAVDMV